MDRPSCIPAPAQVPIVVLGRTSFVVREHLGADVGRDHTGDLSTIRDRRHRTGVAQRPTIAFRGSATLRQSLAEAEPQETVVTGLADAIRTELCPTFQVVGTSRGVGGPAPQAIEAGAKGHGRQASAT